MISLTTVSPTPPALHPPTFVHNAAPEVARKMQRAQSSVLPWSVADKRAVLRRRDEVHARRFRRQQRAEKTLAQQLACAENEQMVVLGKPPQKLPLGPTFVITPHVEAVTHGVHVRCGTASDEWTGALTLSGFNWGRRTTWVMRLDDAREEELAEQLRAVAMMSGAGSVVLLTSWCALAGEVARWEGFSVEVVAGCRKPLLVLTWLRDDHETEQLDEDGAGLAGTLVTFELDVHSVPAEVRRAAEKGRVKVVGDCVELGMWNAEFGVVVVSEEESLMAEIVVDGSCADMEYKYAWVDERGNPTWEAGDNRRLPPTRSALLSVSDRWGSYE
ncbi:Starch binding protein [Gracilaria domingensis]|nr:Starch binding protein [Gracilaria domingensis]